MRDLRSVGLAVLLMLPAGSIARGQVDETSIDVRTPPSVDVVRVVDSGDRVHGGGAGLELLWGQDVRVEGASWLRLWFGPTTLAGDPGARGAFVRISSLTDGAWQELDAEQLARWQGSSAYFNGDAVRVELLAFAGAAVSRVRIERVTAGEDEPAGSTRSICGSTDDRVLSSDPRCARLMPIGCTAWLINDPNRQFLTAGHCGPASGSVVEFNVPLSTSSGGVVHPPPDQQYPVHVPSIRTNGGLGVGNDYAYFGCAPNTTTGLTAFQVQQSCFVLAPNAAPAASGQTLRIAGYGTTSTPISRTWNQVQKVHGGPFTSISGTSLNYRVDTTGGNSGSAVEDVVRGLAIGIHTHGGCLTSGTGENHGTSLHLAAFRTALNAPLGVCRSGIGTPGGPLFVSPDLNNSLGTLNTTTGAFAAVSRFGAPMQGLAFDPRARRFYGVSARTAGGVTTNTLWVVDPDTGAQQALGALTGVGTPLNGLGFDPAGRVLYAIAQAAGQLYRIDSASRACTPLGSPLGGIIGALDFDPATGQLLGIDDQSTGSRLVRIDPTTRTMQTVGALGTGIADCNGLGVDPRDGTIYTIHATNGNLLRLNPATGAATVVGGTLGYFGSGYGMAFAVTSIACPGDADADGTVTVDDLVAFVAWYEAGDLRADLDDGSGTFHRDTGVTIDDLLAFLGSFFAGC